MSKRLAALQRRVAGFNHVNSDTSRKGSAFPAFCANGLRRIKRMTRFTATTKPENPIIQSLQDLHNGRIKADQAGDIVKLCWFANDFLDAKDRLDDSRDLSAVDLYCFLLALNSNNQARLTRKYLIVPEGDDPFPKPLRRKINECLEELGVWAQALRFETASLLKEMDEKRISRELESSTHDLLRAYLLRSNILSLGGDAFDGSKRFSYGTKLGVYDDIRKLFKKYSSFEVMRTNLYEARKEGNIDRALELAQTARRTAEKLGARRYQTVAQEEIERRKAQLVIRDGKIIDYKGCLQKLESADTVEDLFRVTAHALRNQLLGRRIRYVSFLQRQRTGDIVSIFEDADTNFVGEKQKHDLGYGYEMHVSFDAYWKIVNDLVQVICRRLSRLVEHADDSLIVSPSIRFFSPKYRDLVNSLRQIVASPVRRMRILILGKTGTGKGHLAQSLHRDSSATNGGGYAEWVAPMHDRHSDINMLKSDLFGKMPGYGDTSKSKKIGKVETASHGTLFLDEIGYFDIERQSVLLQLLNSFQYEVLGGEGRLLTADCRIITATNKDVLQLIQDGKFLEDLYYRFDHIFELFPLSEVPEEIIPLARRIWDNEVRNYNELAELKIEVQMPEDIEQLFLDYTWPGNVRQMENFIRKLVAACYHEGVPIVPCEIFKRQFDLMVRTLETRPATVPLEIKIDSVSEMEFKSVANETVGGIEKLANTERGSNSRKSNLEIEEFETQLVSKFAVMIHRVQQMRIPIPNIFTPNTSQNVYLFIRGRIPTRKKFNQILDVMKNSEYFQQFQPELTEIEKIFRLIRPPLSGK